MARAGALGKEGRRGRGARSAVEFACPAPSVPPAGLLGSAGHSSSVPDRPCPGGRWGGRAGSHQPVHQGRGGGREAAAAGPASFKRARGLVLGAGEEGRSAADLWIAAGGVRLPLWQRGRLTAFLLLSCSRVVLPVSVEEVRLSCLPLLLLDFMASFA